MKVTSRHVISCWLIFFCSVFMIAALYWLLFDVGYISHYEFSTAIRILAWLDVVFGFTWVVMLPLSLGVTIYFSHKQKQRKTDFEVIQDFYKGRGKNEKQA